MRMPIKALSVNECWLGRKVKSAKYRNYENEMLALLPDMEIGKGPYSLIITVGFSNKASDIDNPIKPIQDILQKRYNFNDKEIYILHVYKVIVKKGEEFIEWKLETIINSKRVM